MVDFNSGLNPPNLGMQALQNQLQGLANSWEQLNQMKNAQLSQQNRGKPRAIEYVNGVAGAKEYLKNMEPNTSAAVFDSNESVFYPLSVDANGIPGPLKKCPFTIEDLVEEKEEYVSKKDFDAFESRILAALQQRNEPPRQSKAAYVQQNQNGQNKGGNQG